MLSMISCSTFSSTMPRDVPGIGQPERMASSTRSSRCRTSIGPASFRLCPASPARLPQARQAPQALHHGRGDKVGDIAAEQRDLLDPAGTDEHELLTSYQADGLDIR